VTVAQLRVLYASGVTPDPLPVAVAEGVMAAAPLAAGPVASPEPGTTCPVPRTISAPPPLAVSPGAAPVAAPGAPVQPSSADQMLDQSMCGAVQMGANESEEGGGGGGGTTKCLRAISLAKAEWIASACKRVPSRA
jgi:hypothetical protein